VGPYVDGSSVHGGVASLVSRAGRAGVCCGAFGGVPSFSGGRTDGSGFVEGPYDSSLVHD
jgi:hypothetical protein